MESEKDAEWADNQNVLSIFFFNDTATTEIYTLSLHDALPIFEKVPGGTPFAEFSNF